MYLFKGPFLMIFLITLNRLNLNKINSNTVKALILLNSLISDISEQKHSYINIFEALN